MMSENRMTSGVGISRRTLFLGWIVFLVIPFLFVKTVAESFIKQDEQAMRNHVQRQLVDEARNFAFEVGMGPPELNRPVVDAEDGKQRKVQAPIQVGGQGREIFERIEKALASESRGNKVFVRGLIEKPHVILPGFQHTAEGLQYRDFLPGVAFQTLLERSETARSLQAISSTPVILMTVTAPANRLVHPLRHVLPFLDLLMKLLLTLGGLLILLQAQLNGIFSPALRTKITLAMGLGIAIPLIGFWMAMASYFSFRDVLLKNEILDSIQLALEVVERNLRGFESWASFEMYQLKKHIESAKESPRQQSLLLDSFVQTGRVGRGRLVYPDDSQYLTVPRSGGYQLRGFGKDDGLLNFVYRHFGRQRLLNLGAGRTESSEPQQLQGRSMFLNSFVESSFDPEIIGTAFCHEGSILPSFDTALYAHAVGYTLYPPGPRFSQSPLAGLMFEMGPKNLWNRYIRTRGALAQMLKGCYPDAPGFSLRFILVERRFRHMFNIQNIWEDPPKGILEAESRSLVHKSMLEKSERRLDALDTASPALLVTRPFPDLPYIGLGKAVPVPVVGMLQFGLIVGMAGYSLFMLVLIAVAMAQVFAQPLRVFVQASHRVQEGDLKTRIHMETGDELEDTAGAFNDMVEGLERKKRMSRFVSEEVRSDVSRSQTEHEDTAVERIRAAVLFAHIREFSTLTSQHPPAAVLNLLNLYFTQMGYVIRRNHGEIDKFIGDAVMAVFRERPGAPPPAVCAATAALGMREALGRFNQFRREKGSFEIDVGIGINEGPVISGRIGSQCGRLDLTVIGDTVNLAARLESHSPLATSGILASETVCRQLPPSFVTVNHGEIRIKGKENPVPVWEILTQTAPDNVEA